MKVIVVFVALLIAVEARVRLTGQLGSLAAEKSQAAEVYNLKCFDTTDLKKWDDKITGKLCGMPRPGYSGQTKKKDPKTGKMIDVPAEDVIKQAAKDIKAAGVDVVISLDHKFQTTIGAALELEKVEHITSIAGQSTYVKDFTTPQTSKLQRFAEKVLQLLHNGKTVAAHCASGMGRTGLHLISVILELILFAKKEAITDEIRKQAVTDAIKFGQTKYRQGAGEFHMVKDNKAALGKFSQCVMSEVKALKVLQKKQKAGTKPSGGCTALTTKDACLKTACTWCSSNKSFKKCRWKPWDATCSGKEIAAKGDVCSD